MRPAQQSLKGKACALSVAPGGDLIWCEDGYSKITRHDWRTKKTTEAKTASPPNHLALIDGETVLGGAFDFGQQRSYAAVYNAASGATTVELRFPEARQTVTAVAVAADGKLFAVSTGHMNAPCGTIELFSSDGRHLESIDLGRQGVTNTADALIFAPDSTSVRYVVRGQLVTHTVGGSASTVPCAIPPQHNAAPRTSRQGGVLLFQFSLPGHSQESFLVDESSGRVLLTLEESELVSFGREGELVWQAGDTIKVFDLSGTERARFKRKKKTRLDAGATNEHGYWCAGGPGGIEVYDLGRIEAITAGGPTAKAGEKT